MSVAGQRGDWHTHGADRVTHAHDGGLELHDHFPDAPQQGDLSVGSYEQLEATVEPE